mmetsp:Transcript_41863/g.35182  ORF Transcript_41863/g.35182 Transcript_41863/m.35182 type:complete len:81 (-) Transcript_41863:8-250(-)
MLFSGSDDGTIKRWDPVTGNCLDIFEGHDASINCLALSADGKTLFSGSDDGSIKCWDSVTGNCLRTLEGDFSKVTSLALI